MQAPLPQTRDIVLVGGGHTHALLLRMWGMAPLPGVRLTLINPGPMAPYTGMLPGYVAGHYPLDALEIDLVRLARHAGARLILAPVTAIDTGARRLSLPGRPAVAYDLLSLNVGIHGVPADLPGFAAFATPAKPLDRFAERWGAFRDRLDPGQVRRAVVIGGGAGGMELAMAMAHGARARGARLEVTVVEAGDGLTTLGQRGRALVVDAAARLGVSLRTATAVQSVDRDAVVLADGSRIASDLTLGAMGPRPHDWLASTGLQLSDGYIAVDRWLRSVSHDNVFAAGDCAHLAHAPRPKAGVFAVRQAGALNRNLRAAMGAGPWQSYRPQRDYLKLISTGGRAAVVDKGGLALAGPWLWRLKDWIDRRFMRRLNDLPLMQLDHRALVAAPEVVQALAAPAPCGGCGAKVGAEPLRQALAGLDGPGDDAAVITVGRARQVITTDTLRAFALDPHLVATTAAHHALGDVFAMGAAPAAALPTIILPPLSDRLQRRTLAEIMAAASAVFDDAGASIVGGHTATGAELFVGFTVTGRLDRAPLALSGAQPGDALILTKAIGTGTVLAGEMRLRARGRDVAASWQALSHGQSAAARILGTAHAATDVTGFGLAGHLLNLLRNSGVGARLDVDAIPLLPGAAALAGAGLRSSMFAANLAATAGSISPDAASRAPLLFDPQTAGGLLAAVPQAAAADLIPALRAAGHAEAAVIGHIAPGAPVIRLA